MNHQLARWQKLARAAGRPRPGSEVAPAGFADAVVARWQATREQATAGWLGLFGERWALRGLGAACGAALLLAVWAWPALQSKVDDLEDPLHSVDVVMILLDS
jgi:hypothetical protein